MIKIKIIIFSGIAILLAILLLIVIGFNSKDRNGTFYFKKLDDGSYSIEKIDVRKTGKTVEIPSSFNGKAVTVIEKGAIPGMTSSLENVEEILIPDSIQKIEAGAFTELPNLKKVTLGANVATIEEWAFAGSYIGAVYLSENNTHFNLINGCLCQDGKLIVGTDDSTIPAGIQRICACAFSEQKIHSIDIPDSCMEIGESAFRGCSFLETVSLPEGLQIIDQHAFSECPNLKTIRLPESLKSIGKYCFYHSGISEIDIPGTVKEIPYEAFARCFYLQRIIIRAGVEAIDYMAFSRSIRLKELEIPSSVKSVDMYAFTATKELVIRYDGEEIPLEWASEWIEFIGYWHDDPDEVIEVESVPVIFRSSTGVIRNPCAQSTP